MTTITISGRIPKYFFGRLKEEFQGELYNVLSIADEDIENEQDFLRLLLSATFDEDSRNNFMELIPLEELEEECPNFFDVFRSIEEGLDHFGLYDIIFDTAENWDGGNGFITFFEDDSKINISNGESVLVETTLGEFSTEVSSYHSEDTPEDDQQRELSEKIKNFIEKNSEEFGLPESLGVGVNEKGSNFISSWFSPPALNEISDNDYSVVILHDEIIEYNFYLDSDFDFNKLTFLTFVEAQSIRQNQCSTIANYVFYDNQVLEPSEKWISDKDIYLEYEPSEGNLDYLLNG